MPSLLLRIFVSFWLIILVTIVAAGGIGMLYAERNRVALENFDMGDAVLEASAALRSDGREGLTEWLRGLPQPAGALVYIVDEKGTDLLDRRLPILVKEFMQRRGRRQGQAPRGRRDTRHYRPARPFSQLVDADGSLYTVVTLPPRYLRASWLFDRGKGTVIALALLASAAMSYLLAQTISRPIRRFRETANAIADGDLGTRVAKRIGDRRDEIGLLAQDFDRMTDGLQRAWLQQTELTRNVSHELRSPLARLRVASELARRRAGDLVELDRIDEETQRLDQLIGQILEFSKLDADRQEASATVDIADVLATVVDDVRFEYAAAADQIALHIDDSHRYAINGYAEALRSCFENVVRNAVQHGGDTGSINITLRIVDSAAVVCVQDTGGGVPEAELTQIFEPFYRSASGQRANRHSGGLGLAIAARVVRLHGGTIAARNGDDGLCVDIHLPVSEQSGSTAS
ncbi:MAG: ATP-binding protein [Pseudomonadota bacterium]